jgi:hypothetical protein
MSAFGELGTGVTVTVPLAFLYLPVPAFSGIVETPLLDNLAVTSLPRSSEAPIAIWTSHVNEVAVTNVHARWLEAVYRDEWRVWFPA